MNTAIEAHKVIIKEMIKAKEKQSWRTEMDLILKKNFRYG
jgi:hypothetical protein